MRTRRGLQRTAPLSLPPLTWASSLGVETLCPSESYPSGIVTQRSGIFAALQPLRPVVNRVKQSSSRSTDLIALCAVACATNPMSNSVSLVVCNDVRRGTLEGIQYGGYKNYVQYTNNDNGITTA